LVMECWSWSVGHGVLVMECWSWSVGHGVLVMECWSWSVVFLRSFDDVVNEDWSSEIGGASRRRNMGPPFGRPHKSCIHRYREMGDISIIG
jgi:hypothetical protein